MAVTLNATGTQQGSTATGLDSALITVASGTDTVLLVIAVWVSNPGAISAAEWNHWGSHQDLSELASATGADGQVVKIYGLVNPLDGNYSVYIQWTNSVEFCINAVALDGADQTGSTTTFPGANSATGTSANASVEVTGGLPANGAAVSVTAAGAAAAISSVIAEQLMLYHGSGAIECGGSYSLATATMTGTYAGTDDWVIAAVGVKATGGATGQFARPAADRTDGNWLNQASSNTDLFESINETAALLSDADYIRSGASPSSDTCTIDLSSIATPQSGTVTLRVRARYV